MLLFMLYVHSFRSQFSVVGDVFFTKNLAQSMLRYFDNCNEVKVGITALQE